MRHIKNFRMFEAVNDKGDFIIEADTTQEEFEGYLRLSAIKYLSRVGHKHGDHDAARAEEYRKAAWFLERLIQEIERER